jgi:hypothetical protein
MTTRYGSARRCGGARAAVPLLAVLSLAAAEPPAAPPSPPAGGAAADVPEVTVEAPEPRYVAPTRRDRIGRIWAPVYLNGRGPFRLVLDTGASHSAVIAEVAAALGLSLSSSEHQILRGVTGSREVTTIPIDSLVVGDLEQHPGRLPVITDALGGAEGVLGAEGLTDKRIVIDFRHDAISIRRSHSERPEPGMVRVPFRVVRGLITVSDARFGDIHVRAIIDTGGQVTIGNPRLRDELLQMYREGRGAPDTITGATDDVQDANRMHAPKIVLGGLTLREVELTISDLYIFQYWKMSSEPAVMIGMDLLGLLDTLIIDYKLHELQIRLR